MRARRICRLLPIVLPSLVTVPAQPMVPDRASVDCVGAAQLAENELGLPSGLLVAIGRVESGRPSPGERARPWPWTTNLAGEGRFFASARDAAEWVAWQQSLGHPSIDVGCFQVNLAYHPNAFVSLDQAFEPAANARYAARFLRELHERVGNWEQAAGLYHSAETARGLAYRDRVLVAWGTGLSPSITAPGGGGGILDPIGIRWSAAARAIRVVMPGASLTAAAAPQTVGRPGLPVVITPGLVAENRR
jgi:hypothetical protein